MTTTAFELDGYRIVKNFGVVRGIMVRSRSVIGNVGASIQALFGGNPRVVDPQVDTPMGLHRLVQ